MTYDRSYTWSKDFEGEVNQVAQAQRFSITKTANIPVDHIKLPIEKTIKVALQKMLSKINLMSYGQEYGVEIILRSNAKAALRCKGWCLNDHLIGLEIEYHNISADMLAQLKQEFKKHFINYNIVWTREPI